MKTVTCFDVFDKPYEVPESEVEDRLSVYGVYIENNKVLLTQDAWARQWELPGGGVDEGESEEEGLKRELWEETGFIFDEVGELVESVQANFYMVSMKKGYKSLRKFYKIRNISKGKLQENGNGSDTIGARFVPLAEIATFTSTEMKPLYKDIIHKSLTLTQ